MNWLDELEELEAKATPGPWGVTALDPATPETSEQIQAGLDSRLVTIFRNHAKELIAAKRVVDTVMSDPIYGPGVVLEDGSKDDILTVLRKTKRLTAQNMRISDLQNENARLRKLLKENQDGLA